MENQLMINAREKFEVACREAGQLQIVNNFGAAFTAVTVIKMLRDALTKEVINEVFMPLMNTKVGFLTDRTGRPRKNGQIDPPYGVETVRDAIIDAVSIGLMPTGNQFNIIAERMYPTKEGYTALLRRLGVKYLLNVSYDKGQNPNFAEIPVKIDAQDSKGEKISFTFVATVKKDAYSSHDQLRGKAERRAKKALYEYVTGCDFGDADEESSRTIDVDYRVVTDISDEIKTELSEKLSNCENAEEVDMLFEMLDDDMQSDQMVKKLFAARKAVLNAGVEARHAAPLQNGNGNGNGSSNGTGNGNGTPKKTLL